MKEYYVLRGVDFSELIQFADRRAKDGWELRQMMMNPPYRDENGNLWGAYFYGWMERDKPKA